MGTTKIKQWRGIWFPADEHHLIQWMEKRNQIVDGKPTYQYHKYEAALAQCKNRRVAIDVGGNLGLWSMHMTNDFEEVHAFEPVKFYASIFELNAPNATLHNLALGQTEDVVQMVAATSNSCGDTRPWVDGDSKSNILDQATMVPLDSFNFANVDFIKIDCEGYELKVLRGAVQTICKCRPVIVVEQKPGHGKTFGYEDDAAVKYLTHLGMRKHSVISGDYIMVW